MHLLMHLFRCVRKDRFCVAEDQAHSLHPIFSCLAAQWLFCTDGLCSVSKLIPLACTPRGKQSKCCVQITPCILCQAVWGLTQRGQNGESITHFQSKSRSPGIGQPSISMLSCSSLIPVLISQESAYLLLCSPHLCQCVERKVKFLMLERGRAQACVHNLALHPAGESPS